MRTLAWPSQTKCKLTRKFKINKAKVKTIVQRIFLHCTNNNSFCHAHLKYSRTMAYFWRKCTHSKQHPKCKEHSETHCTTCGMRLQRARIFSLVNWFANENLEWLVSHRGGTVFRFILPNALLFSCFSFLQCFFFLYSCYC